MYVVCRSSLCQTHKCVYNVFFNVSSVVIVDLEQMSFYALAEMKGVINAESAFAE